MASPTLDVTRLTPADAGELLTLRRAAYASLALSSADQADRLLQDLAEVTGELADPGRITLGGRLGPRLVASITIAVGRGVATLARFAVAPDLQQQGIGRQLIAAVPGALPESVSEVRVEPLPGMDDDVAAAGGSDGPSVGELMAAYLRSVGDGDVVTG